MTTVGSVQHPISFGNHSASEHNIHFASASSSSLQMENVEYTISVLLLLLVVVLFIDRPTDRATTVHRIIIQTLDYTCHAHSRAPLRATPGEQSNRAAGNGGPTVHTANTERGGGPTDRPTEVKHKCHARHQSSIERAAAGVP